MSTVVNIIRHRPGQSLILVTLMLLVTAAMMARTGRCLKTKYAQRGIVSLELAWSQENADTIRNEWQNSYCSGDVIQTRANAAMALKETSVIEKAKKNILDDSYFILAYTLFFIVCMILIDPKSAYSSDLDSTTRIFVTVAVAAALLDAIENLFMYRFINGSAVSAISFGLPAYLKFGLVIVMIARIVFYLVRISVARIRS